MFSWWLTTLKIHHLKLTYKRETIYTKVIGWWEHSCGNWEKKLNRDQSKEYYIHFRKKKRKKLTFKMLQKGWIKLKQERWIDHKKIFEETGVNNVNREKKIHYLEHWLKTWKIKYNKEKHASSQKEYMETDCSKVISHDEYTVIYYGPDNWARSWVRHGNN